MKQSQVEDILKTAQESNAVHYYARLMKVSEFKQKANLTVGNMQDITYANPDKMSIGAHKHKVARLTHKFVVFYEWQGVPKVIVAGTLEGIASYINKCVESHAAQLVIVNGD